MKHTEARLQGPGQRSIYCQCWEPETAPKAILLLVHGAGEHSGRYLHVAEFFVEQGLAVLALDHRGHGHSDGKPGHIDVFDDYLVDLAVFHNEVERRFPGVPIFLLGHSLGGLIACNYLLQQQDRFVGCILSGALIKSDLQPGWVQMGVIQLLALLAPRLGVMQLDASGVSRDAEEVKKYVEDPLVLHGKASARMVRELFAGMGALQAGAAGITLPMLMLHGDADVLTSPDGSRYLHQHISSTDKTLTIYPGLYHEILNEPERQDVLDQILSWCEARLIVN
jgi:alpha-beta hydrolase superfamily lysophospholipase